MSSKGALASGARKLALFAAGSSATLLLITMLQFWRNTLRYCAVVVRVKVRFVSRVVEPPRTFIG